MTYEMIPVNSAFPTPEYIAREIFPAPVSDQAIVEVERIRAVRDENIANAVSNANVSISASHDLADVARAYVQSHKNARGVRMRFRTTHTTSDGTRTIRSSHSFDGRVDFY